MSAESFGLFKKKKFALGKFEKKLEDKRKQLKR